MAELNKIVSFLDYNLKSNSYIDSAYNGLQIDGGKIEVNKISLAVDAGESVIDRATAEKSDLLICHHGLYWGQKNQTVTGIFGKKVLKLFDAKCSLYASHLPLDGNKPYGNAYQLAKSIKLGNLKPFLNLDGNYIGFEGVFTQPKNISSIEKILRRLIRDHDSSKGYYPFTLNFGKDKIKKVGIVTGSGSLAISQAAEAGHDLLITGEPKQEAFHLAKELKINVIFAGHYATEVYGVMALGQALRKKFKVATLFIDEPTGI